MDPLVLVSDVADEDQLTAAIKADNWMGPLGSICISVAEEQVMDSYNQMFTCSFHMTRKQAASLRDWLSAALS